MQLVQLTQVTVLWNELHMGVESLIHLDFTQNIEIKSELKLNEKATNLLSI